MGIIRIMHLYWKLSRRMSLIACKRLAYILFQFKSSSSNCSIHFCSDFLPGGIFFFISNLYVYLFVCFDLIICPRIDDLFFSFWYVNVFGFNIIFP